MKRVDFRIVLLCILLISAGCSAGTCSVAALSPEGESLIGNIVAAGSTLGVDIGSIAESVLSTQETTTVYYPDAQSDIRNLFAQLGMGDDILAVTDLIAYLNRGGSLESWIYDNYGDNIEIPASVKAMPPSEVALFLVGNILYPQQTQETTTPKYVFDPGDETTGTEPSTSETTTLLPEFTGTTQKDENHEEATEGYITGDVDSDGRVTAKDARAVLRFSAGIEQADDRQLLCADVNGDGRVTAKDARSILRFSAKLASGF